MESRNSHGLWNKVFNIDSQAGTGRFVVLILAFIIVGGGLSWLIG